MEEKPQEHQERWGVASAGAVVALALGGMMALGVLLSPDDDAAAELQDPPRTASAPVWSTPAGPSMSTVTPAPDLTSELRRVASECGGTAGEVQILAEQARETLADAGVARNVRTILYEVDSTGAANCTSAFNAYVIIKSFGSGAFG